MGTRRRISGITRLGAVLVLAAGVGVLGQTGATAASVLPAPPLADLTPPVTRVVGVVTGTLGSQPASPTGQPASQPASRPVGSPSPGPSGTSGASSPSNASSNQVAHADTAPATDKDTVVGADVTVRDLLGACVRLTSSGVPARATILVLDQNLLDQLRAVGLPVDKLVVPCPVGAATGATGGTSGTGGGATSAGATSANGAGDPQGSGASGLLAFTGADPGATLLLAAGLVALGIAFLRKAHALAQDGTSRAQNA